MKETRSRLISGALFGFFQTVMMAFAIIIPARYFMSLNLSIETYALLLLIGDVCAFLIKPLIGYFTDKKGERRFLLIGGCSFFVALFLIGLTDSVLLITILKIIAGVASATMFILILIYSLRFVQEKPDKKVGRFAGVYNLGWIVGFLVPGIIAEMFSIPAMFYLIPVFGIVWVLLMFRFAKRYESTVSVRPSFKYLRKIPALIVLKSMDLAMFSAFVFYFSEYVLANLGLSPAIRSTIAVVEVIFFAATMFLVGQISNTSLRKYWIPLCIIFHLLAATVIIAAVSTNLLVLHFLVAIFIGVAGGFIDIWILSKISETYQYEEKGVVLGTFGWSYDFATIAGASIPILFLWSGLAVYTSLFFFPIVIMITYILMCTSSRFVKIKKTDDT